MYTYIHTYIVYSHTYIQMYMYVCLYVYVCIYVCMYIYVCIWMCMYVYMYMCLYVCVCVYAYMYNVYLCMQNILGELSGGMSYPKREGELSGGIVRENCPTPHLPTDNVGLLYNVLVIAALARGRSGCSSRNLDTNIRPGEDLNPDISIGSPCSTLTTGPPRTLNH